MAGCPHPLKKSLTQHCETRSAKKQCGAKMVADKERCGRRPPYADGTLFHASALEKKGELLSNIGRRWRPYHRMGKWGAGLWAWTCEIPVGGKEETFQKINRTTPTMNRNDLVREECTGRIP